MSNSVPYLPTAFSFLVFVGAEILSCIGPRTDADTMRRVSASPLPPTAAAAARTGAVAIDARQSATHDGGAGATADIATAPAASTDAPRSGR